MTGVDIGKKMQEAMRSLEAGGSPAPEGKDVQAESSTADSGVHEDSPSSPTETPSSDKEALSEKSQRRFQDLANAKKELESQLQAAREELRKQREESSSAKVLEFLKKERPEGYDDWPEDDRQAYVAHKAAKASVDNSIPEDLRSGLRTILLKDHVRDVLPDLNRDQVGAVVAVLNELDNRIPAHEAAAVAARRNPEIFAQATEQDEPKPKAKPSSFQAQRPSQEGRERLTESERQERELLEQIDKAPHYNQKMRLAAAITRLRKERRS